MLKELTTDGVKGTLDAFEMIGDRQQIEDSREHEEEELQQRSLTNSNSRSIK